VKVWVMVEWGPGEVIGVVSSPEEAERRGFVLEDTPPETDHTKPIMRGTFSGPFEIDEADTAAV
jgi:hypothetical protein